MNDDDFLAIKTMKEQERINVWFDERIRRLEKAYYIQVAENAILIPLIIAIFIMVFHI
jgi:hypothetical protein